MSEIDDKYDQLGGARSFLGRPIHEEHSCPDGVGRYREFTQGSIHWHPSHGAFETHGAIRIKWAQMRFELGPLGYPISDERNVSEAELAELLAPGRDTELAATAKNRCSDFQRGRIFCWSPDTHRYFTTVITPGGARTDEEHKRSNATNHVAEAAKCAGTAAAGAAAGYGVVAATGMTAAGMIGSGAGIGAAAGPVGAAIGAVVALAGFGVWKIFSK